MVMPTERDFSIQIEHLPTSEIITFVGWVTAFSDNFSSEWSSTPVYGRMDPLATFQGTQRKITLAFDVVAGDKLQAVNNDLKINRLIQFLYPVYDRGSSTTGTPPDQAIVAAAPLLRMRYANLIQNNKDQGGLVGYLDGVDYSPNIEAGQFFAPGLSATNPFFDDPGGTAGAFVSNTTGANTIYYQETSISLSFTVLHSHLTGWVKGADNTFYFGGEGNTDFLGNFPHGGSSTFRAGGREPARVIPPASADDALDPTEPGQGNNADINAHGVESITTSSEL